MTRRYTTVTIALALLLIGGACTDLTVPDLNNPSLEDAITNPNRAKIAAEAAGLLIGHRATFAGRAGYISELGIFGRESYNFDAADPRFITELLIGPLVAGNGAFGGNHWTGPYVNMRNADIMLQAIDGAPDLSAGEKDAARGFAKTIQALDLLAVINTHDVNGAVIDLTTDPTGEPAAIVDKAAVFTRIAQLLDDADANLGAASDFPFPLTSGFAGFDTPSTFRQFNRAVRARVAVYMGDFATALTALSGSFLDTSASMDLGVYHVFSTGSGDALNALFDPSSTPDLLAHPSIETDAQLQADGVTPDDRFVRKVVRLSASRTTSGITTDLAFSIYTSNTSPIPIIRNEELILLRAEANIGLGNLATAQTDLNVVRTVSGKLPALTTPFATTTEAVDELLYNRRYSLLFEGHRWIDVRRFGRLNTLPLDLPTHAIFSEFPIPQGECDARTNKPPVCS